MRLPAGVKALSAGAAAGLAGGLFGVGGGIILVPALLAMFAATPQSASGTSLATLAATALAGAIVYAMHGDVAWPIAALLALASIPTARLGARLAARSSHRTLLRTFAVLLLVVSLRLLLKAQAPVAHVGSAGPWVWAAAVALGVAAGMMSGFLGVGGGIILVPALGLLFGMPQHLAQGTSLAVILVTAPVGAFEAARHGNVIRRLVPWLFVGAALGAPLSSSLAMMLPREALTRLFAIFLLVNAILTWRRAAAPARRS